MHASASDDIRQHVVLMNTWPPVKDTNCLSILSDGQHREGLWSKRVWGWTHLATVDMHDNLVTRADEELHSHIAAVAQKR